MADDTTLNAGTAGDKMRTLDDGTRKWPAGVSAYVTTLSPGANVVVPVDITHGLPTQPMTGSLWSLAAGELHVGEVGAKSDLVDLTFSLDTSPYASGDLLADTQAIVNAVRVATGTAVLQDIVLNDEDDQGVAMTLYFYDTNVSMGTENSPPSITDANQRTCLGYVDVAATDWKDLGGVKTASIKNIGLVVKPASGRDIYVGIVNGTSAPTFTASGIKGRFKLLQD